MAGHYVTTEAVILKEMDYGDADKLITVLTPTRGQLTVLCRGVRHLKSRRFAAVQLFTYADMTLEEKNGRLTLAEAELKENFFELRGRLEAFAAASYFADLILSFTVEEEGEPEVMRLFLNALYLMAKRPEKPLSRIKTVFEIRLAALAGLMPDLSGCTVCGKRGENGWLDVAGGVFLCEHCAFGEEVPDGEERVLMPMDAAAVQLFSFVASAEGKRIFSFALPAVSEELAGRAAEKYITYALGKIPETLTFYHTVQ